MSSGLTAELDVKAELESFAVLYRAEVIASLCAEDEPVAFANKFSPDGFPTDSEPLYSAETVAALQARVAELEMILQMGYSETMDYIKLNKLGAENNQWLRLAREALRSKK